MDKRIIAQQQDEITEHHVYNELAALAKNEHNRKTLLKISREEKTHYEFWKSITKLSLKPDSRKVKKFVFLAKIFGLSFSLRLLEKGEADASKFYSSLKDKYPQVVSIQKDEEEHEKELISILKDSRLEYAGAIVLGLNDALVEFTGTLAGLTFAFADNKIVGTMGIIMGIAASLSMAASGYLSSKENDGSSADPITSAVYTGFSYIITVLLLVAPYLLQDDPYIALSGMLVTTVAIIALYTYYISVAKNISFKSRFWEMVGISLGVAVLSFGIGTIVKDLIV
jgi:VIT1/CCC1 family predicted Fe2+/Mn2+ transporter